MSDYCEMPEWYSVSWPTARKRHHCIECSAPIEVGEKYFCGSGKWDGGVTTHRQHLDCEAACRHIRDFILDDCIAFGELFDVYYEFAEQRIGSYRDLRTIMARVKWRAKKKRPLGWLQTRSVSNPHLERDRARGWV